MILPVPLKTPRARTWAVEGANGTGRPLSQRLLADGERVLDVPAKVAARSRPFDTGHARKTDAHDPHAIVMVALRTRGLRQLQVDEDLAVLRLLADRRDELSPTRAQNLNRLHRLLAELIGGGAKRDRLLDARDLLGARDQSARALLLMASRRAADPQPPQPPGPFSPPDARRR